MEKALELLTKLEELKDNRFLSIRIFTDMSGRVLITGDDILFDFDGVGELEEKLKKEINKELDNVK